MSEAWDEPAWARLADELDRWADRGRAATLWWRDDDAGQPHPALERLLALAEGAGVPVALAVVPAWLTPEVTAQLCTAAASVVVLQHGLAHVNHEHAIAPGERKVRPAECGGARPPAVVATDLREGWGRLRAALGSRCLPILVPPWNRIAPDVLSALPTLGYRAVSAFGSRPVPAPIPGLRIFNCHVDPINWREGRRFVGAGPTLEGLRRHLADRLAGRVDPDEPTGLLTHHRDLTPALWAFLEELSARLRPHPAVRWESAVELLGPQPSA